MYSFVARFAVFTVLSCSNFPEVASQQVMTPHEFEAEARPHWTEIERQCWSANGVVETSASWNSEPSSQSGYEIFSNGRGFATQSTAENNTVSLFLKSPGGYIAHLKKRVAGDWVLTDMNREIDIDFYKQWEIDRTIRGYSPLSLWRVTVTELWEKVYFKAVKVEFVEDGLYRVTFESRHDPSDDKNANGVGVYTWIQGGTIIFDSNRRFVVRSAELDCLDIDGSAVTIRLKYTYPNNAELVLPVASHSELEKIEGTLIGETTYRWRYGKLPEDSEFMLSAFGIPEPDWYRPPPPYWLYVSIAGMALLLIGALLIRYGKQLWRRG